MKYLFFDTALNGYYTLLALRKEFSNTLPLIGKEENISDDAAPFIFEISDEKLASFLSTEHISFKEVLFAESNETLATVRDYFSRFVVQNIKGREFYFRFWAANVFVKYISTCKTNQLGEFFKTVESFSCENKGETIKFLFDGRKLLTENTSLLSVLPVDSGLPNARISTVHKDETKGSGEKDGWKAPRRFF